jgi:hypothetical protein
MGSASAGIQPLLAAGSTWQIPQLAVSHVNFAKRHLDRMIVPPVPLPIPAQTWQPVTAATQALSAMSAQSSGLIAPLIRLSRFRLSKVWQRRHPVLQVVGLVSYGL